MAPRPSDSIWRYPPWLLHVGCCAVMCVGILVWLPLAVVAIVGDLALAATTRRADW